MSIPLRYFCLYLGVFLSMHCGVSLAEPATQALALQKTYKTLEDSLLRSPLKRPIHIASEESSARLSGDLHAVLDTSLEGLANATGSTQRWCEIMLLLSNTKACHARPAPQNAMQVFVSSSKNIDAADATATEFLLDTQGVDRDYFESSVTAKDGPMGTQDIRLRLQAIALTPSRAFLRLHYSYTTHWLGRVAMQAYLQTLGRGKVGFTLAPDASSSAPVYIGGARAVIERNTMRYFLGLECALASASQEAPQRFMTMTDCWYGQVEKYPLQLHEMQRAEYVQMKALQYQR